MRVDRYTWDLQEGWRPVEPFITGIVTDALPDLSYPWVAVITGALNADWYANVTRDVVACTSGPPPSLTSRGRQRDLAPRLGDHLGSIPSTSPTHQLLHAAGVKSMDALVRYEKFLPQV